MPTYQYKCSHCSHEFEEFQSMKDSPLTICPKCKQERLYRVIGAGGGMIFKGSGFYLTDYKGSGNRKNDTPAEKKTETKNSDHATKPASETKPDN